MSNWKKISAVALIVFIVGDSCFAATSQVDALINKLVEKNILTREEALAIQEEALMENKGEKVVYSDNALPDWVKNTKLKGDFRLRYQYERKQTDTDARARGRIRYRLGLETEVVKNVKVGVGLATGSDDPRSTNQSFTDTFETSDIRLDYAYAEWQTFKNDQDLIKLIGGVHPRSDYLWTATDLLWDTDITTQGGAIHGEHQFHNQWTGYANSGIWVIDENGVSDSPDPFLGFAQGGIKFKSERWSSNVAAIYYSLNGLKGTCPDWSSATNTGITSASSGACTGALKYDYDSIGTSAEIAFDNPFGLKIEQAALFGDYIYNMDNKDDNDNNLDDPSGWAIGSRIGDQKVNDKGKWQFKYIFASLGKDAWPDFLPDSDRLAGKTDVRSHEGILEFGINKNVTVALDYYQSRRIKAAKALEHLIQADLNFKF